MIPTSNIAQFNKNHEYVRRRGLGSNSIKKDFGIPRFAVGMKRAHQRNDFRRRGIDDDDLNETVSRISDA